MQATQHTAAIHVLKGLLKLSDDDYRALLRGLTQSPLHPGGKDSCTKLSSVERAFVRAHMDKLALRMGAATPRPAARAAEPRARRSGGVRERELSKLRAMLYSLADVGAVERPVTAYACDHALLVWAKRQLAASAAPQLDALQFATGMQMGLLIEGMKAWQARVGARPA